MQQKSDQRVKVWVVRPTDLPKRGNEGKNATVMVLVEPCLTGQVNQKLDAIAELAKRRTNISDWQPLTCPNARVIGARATIPACCRREMDRAAATLAHIARQQFGPKIQVGEHQVPSNMLFERLLLPQE